MMHDSGICQLNGTGTDSATGMGLPWRGVPTCPRTARRLGYDGSDERVDPLLAQAGTDEVALSVQAGLELRLRDAKTEQ